MLLERFYALKLEYSGALSGISEKLRQKLLHIGVVVDDVNRKYKSAPAAASSEKGNGDMQFEN